MTYKSEYDKEAEYHEWNAPDVIFGLSYEYIRPGAKLLDLGIGTGLSSVLFDQAGMTVYGMDISEENIRVCREKGFAADLRQHSLLEAPYPFQTEFFDLAVSLAVFNFFADLRVIFEEVLRLLKPGGIFAFAVEDLKEGQPDTYVYTDRAHSEGIEMHRHSRAYLDEIFTGNGFSFLKTTEFLAWKGTEGNDDMYFTIYVMKRI